MVVAVHSFLGILKRLFSSHFFRGWRCINLCSNNALWEPFMQAECVLIWTSSSLNRLNSGWDHQSALLWVPGEEMSAWKMQWNTKSAGVTWTDSLCNFTAFSSSRLRRVGDLDYTKCCATFQLWIKVCQAFQSSGSPAVCSAELVDHSLGPGLFFWDSARITWNLYYSWNNDGGKLEKSRLVSSTRQE